MGSEGEVMTAEEMIKKLSTIPPETVIIWEDAVEGNDCEVASIYMTNFLPSRGRTKEEYAYISPSEEPSADVRML